MSTALDADVVRRLTEREVNRFQERTQKSLALARRSVEVMPLGVPTNVCALDPYPLAIVSGEGAYITDLDGNRYVDYANGFGAMVMGHAHPAIQQAICDQGERGIHFGALTVPIVELAEHLVQRYSLNWIRFSNSGTEATMDALRLARAWTGRTKIAKIEGGYHGSHQDALVSTNMPLDGSEGPDDRPASRRWGEGLPERLEDEVVALVFNDLDGASRMLENENIAAILIEPILFNVGAIWPAPGYLAGLRELCDRTGTLLIWDETKTAATVAYGGAEELFGVQPHIKTMGKGIGGGVGVGALGGTDPLLYDLIQEWRVPHLGTFAGNPLMAAAGVAAMTEVLTPEALDGLAEHFALLSSRLQATIDEHQLPAYVVGSAAKGCIVWADHRLQDFRDYKRNFDGAAANLAWLYLMNRGVFLAPGHDEQWTHSVVHGDQEAELFADAFAQLAGELRA